MGKVAGRTPSTKGLAKKPGMSILRLLAGGRAVGETRLTVREKARDLTDNPLRPLRPEKILRLQGGAPGWAGPRTRRTRIPEAYLRHEMEKYERIRVVGRGAFG